MINICSKRMSNIFFCLFQFTPFLHCVNTWQYFLTLPSTTRPNTTSLTNRCCWPGRRVGTTPKKCKPCLHPQTCSVIIEDSIIILVFKCFLKCDNQIMCVCDIIIFFIINIVFTKIIVYFQGFIASSSLIQIRHPFVMSSKVIFVISFEE